jgi:hypothetical protein
MICVGIGYMNNIYLNELIIQRRNNLNRDYNPICLLACLPNEEAWLSLTDCPNISTHCLIWSAPLPLKVMSKVEAELPPRLAKLFAFIKLPVLLKIEFTLYPGLYYENP